MDTHSGSIRCGPRHEGILAVVALFLSLTMAYDAFASESTSVKKFTLTGSGALKPDQATQRAGSFKLKAYLTPKDAALAASPPVQEGSGFALMAKLAAASLVCYNDTIFRDDFDGDGG